MSEFVFIQGKGNWIKAVTPNKFGDWSFQIHPNKESLEIIRELQSEGLKNTLKKDDDGYYISFKRPPFRKIKGRNVPLNPPKVIDKEGNPMDGSLVGNGSDITAKLEVYSHPTPTGGRAKAARWEGLRVDSLVEFNRNEDWPEDEAEQVRGLAEQPEQIF